MNLTNLTIGVDIDGTLTNDIQIAKECIRMWNLHVQGNESRIVTMNPKSVKLFKFPEQTTSSEFFTYTKSIHEKPTVDAFTVAALQGIHRLGCKIVIITRRQIGYAEYTSENPHTETRKWLENQGVVFDKLICTNDTPKAPFLKEYNCKYILENDPMILKDLIDHNCRTIPVLLRKPYNQEYEAYFTKRHILFINSIYDFYVYLININSSMD